MRAQGQVSRRNVRAAAGPEVTVETNASVAAVIAAAASRSMVSNRGICSELLRDIRTGRRLSADHYDPQDPACGY